MRPSSFAAPTFSGASTFFLVRRPQEYGGTVGSDEYLPRGEEEWGRTGFLEPAIKVSVAKPSHNELRRRSQETAERKGREERTVARSMRNERMEKIVRVFLADS